MFRPAVIAVLITSAGFVEAAAQTNLPSNPVPPANMLQVPPPTSPPAPPQAPLPAAIPQMIAPTGAVKATPGWNAQKPNDSFGDRVSRCVQFGTAAGVAPNSMGSFTAQCAN